MNRPIILLLLLCLFSLSFGQHGWYNAQSPKTSLVLTLHFSDNAVALYSPLQSQEPIPATKYTNNGGTIHIACGSIGLKIDLNFNDKENTLSGVWQQSIIKENITFYHSDTIFSMVRPQTPQPPFSFGSEQICTEYVDPDGEKVHLCGTLTYPHEGKKFPLVLLVSGSGQQNRDEEIFFHKPFLVLANFFAQHGIATLRYDDRGVGESKGSIQKADTRIFSYDAEAMLDAVKDNRVIDTNHIILMGHSEGALIVSMVAARRKDISMIVLLAGQGFTGDSILLQQNEAIYRASGVSQSLVNVRLEMLKETFLLPESAKLKDYRNIVVKYNQQLTPEQQDSIALTNGSAKLLYQQMNNQWMMSFLRLDPADYLPHVGCKVVAINGSLDCQVLAEPNLRRIKKLCNADTILLPSLNHLFQHCDNGSPSRYMFIEQTLDPSLLSTLIDVLRP